MAHQRIYKDIQLGNEGTWGSSIAPTERLHIRTMTLNKVVEKEIADDTTSSIKGRERMNRLQHTIEGDITAYGTPRNFGHFFELANGALGTTATLGSSALVMTYSQNTDGTMISKTLNVDRNNSQETFNGVRASNMEISASDNKVELSLSTQARYQSDVGTAIQDLQGETTKPATFADVTVTVDPGSYGDQAETLKVSEWSLTYDNGLETQHLSGDRDPARSDPNVPTLEGSFSIFHTGISYVELSKGCSEAYIRFDIVYPSCAGLIAGVTPYTTRIDVPRAELTSNVRNYESGELSVEEVEFSALFDLGTSSLWQATQTVGF